MAAALLVLALISAPPTCDERLAAWRLAAEEGARARTALVATASAADRLADAERRRADAAFDESRHLRLALAVSARTSSTAIREVERQAARADRAESTLIYVIGAAAVVVVLVVLVQSSRSDVTVVR